MTPTIDEDATAKQSQLHVESSPKSEEKETRSEKTTESTHQKATLQDPTITVPSGIPQLDESTPLPPAKRPELLIITGMSGAGRTRAGMALEDLDWYVVDNLPPRMLLPIAHMMTPDGGGVHRLAVIADVRSGEFFSEFNTCLDQLKESNIAYQVYFLDASDEELVRRYEGVRRPHPLQGKGRIMDGIIAERKLLDLVRRRADVYLDTSNYSVHDLARKIRDSLGVDGEQQLQISVTSFGFKYGLPLDADHVVDVRFFSNPYWVSELRHLTGKEKPVADYVLSQPGARSFAKAYVAALTPVLGGYLRELKPFATIAVGCTGGKHRSVAMAEYITELLREAGFSARTFHRDLGLE